MKDIKSYDVDVRLPNPAIPIIISKSGYLNCKIAELKDRLKQDRMFYYGFSLLTDFKMQYFIASVDKEFKKIRCYGLDVDVKFENDRVSTKYVLTNNYGKEIHRSNDDEKLDIARPLVGVSINGIFKSEHFTNRFLMFYKVPGIVDGKQLDMFKIVRRCFPFNVA